MTVLLPEPAPPEVIGAPSSAARSKDKQGDKEMRKFYAWPWYEGLETTLGSEAGPVEPEKKDRYDNPFGLWDYVSWFRWGSRYALVMGAPGCGYRDGEFFSGRTVLTPEGVKVYHWKTDELVYVAPWRDTPEAAAEDAKRRYGQ